MLYGKSLNPQTLKFVRSQVFDDESVARSRARTVARRGRRRATPTATDLDTRTLSLTHLSPPARWPCRWRWPLPRRAALGVDCPLVFGLGKRSWMLNIRVLCTGIRGERRQAGRRASPASAGAALVSTSSLDTTTPSVVGGGECAGSVAGRGPVGSGPGAARPGAFVRSSRNRRVAGENF